MTQVSYQQMVDYIKEHDLKPRQGSVFHSTEYVDEQGIVKAYHETSSWHMNDFCQIEGNHANFETVIYVSNLLR